MTLPSSGLITIDMLNSEMERPSGFPITLNDQPVRNLAGASSSGSAISFANLYGKNLYTSTVDLFAGATANFEIVYKTVSNPAALYKSTNYGVTWTSMSIPFSSPTQLTQFAVSRDGTRIMLMAYTSTGNIRNIYYSTNSGTSWSSPISQTSNWNYVAPDLNVMYRKPSSLGLQYSTNWGSTWTDMGSNTGTIINFAFSPDANRCAYSYLGPVMLSLTNGEPWYDISSNMSSTIATPYIQSITITKTNGSYKLHVLGPTGNTNPNQIVYSRWNINTSTPVLEKINTFSNMFTTYVSPERMLVDYTGNFIMITIKPTTNLQAVSYDGGDTWTSFFGFPPNTATTSTVLAPITSDNGVFTHMTYSTTRYIRGTPPS